MQAVKTVIYLDVLLLVNFLAGYFLLLSPVLFPQFRRVTGFFGKILRRFRDFWRKKRKKH